MNKENLEILASRIEKTEHKGYTSDDDTIEYAANSFNLNKEYFNCGAPSCIAGWAASLASDQWNIKKIDLMGTTMNFLGIDRETYEDLCYPFRAFEDSGMEFDDVTPDMAAKVIRNLAETGEVDWTIVGVKEIEDNE